MAKNDLKIKVIATLNTGLSITQINVAIKGIEKKINHLKLKIDIEDRVLNALIAFAKAMQKVNVNVNQTTTSFEKMKTSAQKMLQDLARTGKYTTDELRKIGQSLNMAKSIQEIEKLKNRMRNMKFGSSFEQQQEKLRQSLKKISDQGLITERNLNRFNSMINSAKNVAEIEKIQKAMKRVSETQNNKNLQQKMLNDAQKVLQFNTKNLNIKNINDINKLIASLKNIKPNANNATKELNQLQNQLKGYQNQMQQASHHTLTFGSALKQALSGFSLWAVTAQVVYAPIRALQDMTQRLIQIDQQMTDIRRVMDEPDYKFVQMLSDAVDTSDQLSTKLSDVLNIMGSFGRMGFDDSQLLDITKTAQVLQNISDLDADSSVDTLTSAMLNFNIAAQDSMTIADKLNEVDNNFAINWSPNVVIH
jgi:archaellum component FlaC